jgi:hypothetical protein
MQIRFWYESVWLKVEITQQILLEFSRNEFQDGVNRFMGYVGIYCYDLMQTMLQCGKNIPEN